MIFEKSSQIINENNQIPERGKIFDRNGVLLASTIKTHSLYVHPRKLKNLNNLSNKLKNIILISEDEIKNKLLKKNNFQFIIFLKINL